LVISAETFLLVIPVNVGIQDYMNNIQNFKKVFFKVKKFFNLKTGFHCTSPKGVGVVNKRNTKRLLLLHRHVIWNDRKLALGR